MSIAGVISMEVNQPFNPVKGNIKTLSLQTTQQRDEEILAIASPRMFREPFHLCSCCVLEELVNFSKGWVLTQLAQYGRCCPTRISLQMERLIYYWAYQTLRGVELKEHVLAPLGLHQMGLYYMFFRLNGARPSA